MRTCSHISRSSLRVTPCRVADSTVGWSSGIRAGAEVCLLRLLATPQPAHFASIDAGLRGYNFVPPLWLGEGLAHWYSRQVDTQFINCQPKDTEAVNEHLRPLRRRRAQLATDRAHLREVLHRGNARANEVADVTLRGVREAMDMAY